MGFVELKQDGKLFVDLQYPKQNMANATDRCLLRRDAVLRLKKAAGFLLEGVCLCIWDAWRPFALQTELYAEYAGALSARGMDPDAYVCPPCREFGQEPVHTTGGAVDVTLCGPSGQLLDMGSAFDDFGPVARAFADGLDPEVMERRALLRNVMLQSGFTVYGPEWWHFDFGDRFWAMQKGKAVVYSGVFTEDDIVFEM